MRLMDRDIEVIRAVHEHRMLRADQIQRLLFPSRNTANARLQRLFHHRFLDRRWRPVEYGHGMGQAFYLLGRRAAQLLVERLGVQPSLRVGRRDSRTLRSPFIEHTCTVNDVRIAITLGVTDAGCTLQSWLREDELKASRTRVKGERSLTMAGATAIIPDAAFSLRRGPRQARFLLEVDRATESNVRWAQRVRNYMALLSHERVSQRLGSYPRILVVTTGPARLEHLKTATEDAGGQAQFWFTFFSRVQPDTVLTKPIWRVAGRQGDHVLVSKGTDPAPLRGLEVVPRS
jgi:hypothetical protein